MQTITPGAHGTTQIPLPATAPNRAPNRAPNPRSRPDPGALRIAGGFAAVAAASAMMSAMLTPAPAATAAVAAVAAAAPAAAQPEVVHVVRYVTLQPGQSAPPQAVVQQPAAPAPRIVTVTTRQSGAKP